MTEPNPPVVHLFLDEAHFVDGDDDTNAASATLKAGES